MRRRPNSPNDSCRDELQQGTEQEGETSHEVQRRWVQGVVERSADQKTQTLHASNSSKQGTYWNDVQETKKVSFPGGDEFYTAIQIASQPDI